MLIFKNQQWHRKAAVRFFHTTPINVLYIDRVKDNAY